LKDQLIFIEKVTIVVYIVMCLGSAVSMNLPIILGVALGGALGLVNFDLFIRIGAKVFEEEKRPRWSYFAFAWVKFTAVIAMVFLALLSRAYHPVALVIGLTDFVIGIVLGVMIYAVRHPFEEEPEEGQAGEETPVDTPGDPNRKPGS
jgi:hypothetical protein